ncbi:cell wall anchor protein [Flavobacterium sp. FlaQc-28]|uniref:cell wall anchor protein n=1 Tax=Flavobacterium sp. FlaQc-28 TaxID=3374178 RepID=UPI003757F635
MKKITLIFGVFIYTLISNAQVAGALLISDTRSVNDAPNFIEHSIRADFKDRSIIGVPGGGMYSTNLTIAQWEDTDNSGGANHQLNFNNGGIFYRNAYPLDSQWGKWQQLLMTNIDGNVGIGVDNPRYKLQIGEYNNGGIFKLSIPGVYNFEEVKLGQYGNGRTGLEMITHTNQTQSYGVRLYSGTDTGVNGLLIETADACNSADELKYTAKMVVNLSGNVGIGVLNPLNKLDVNGTIHSKEVKVDMNGWSDFVFKKEYNLPTLEQVEKHIVEKGHLENIPCEKEVLENGIDLGEMNAKLLQKIEELTLYMIEMKKENLEIKNENDLMKKNQVQLENRILNLENR